MVFFEKEGQFSLVRNNESIQIVLAIQKLPSNYEVKQVLTWILRSILKKNIFMPQNLVPQIY